MWKHVIFILLIFLCCKLISNNSNNACNNYGSYLNIYFSKNCYNIPDLNNDVTEIIERHVGDYEEHKVETEDGYILTIFRIPHENPKDVIYFHHPIVFDSKFWVAQYKDSIAFKFWQKRYDVWLGNARGTLYSKKHKVLTPSDGQFWNYSYHEMGYFDNLAVINYVRTITNKSKIIYIGVSLGANAGFVYASTRATSAANSLKIVVAISPVFLLTHLNKVWMAVKPFLMLLKKWDEISGYYSTFARHNSWYMKLWRFFYYYNPFKKIILFIINPFLGYVWDEFDPNFANLMVMQMGSEFSLKSIYHSYQLQNSGNKLQMYDYGPETNYWVYGNITPPDYPLHEIKVPIFIVHSKNDSLSIQEDVENLYHQLPEKARLYGKLEVEGMNHNDFGFGQHRMELVYDKVLQLLDSL